MVVKHGMSQRNDRKSITSVKTPVSMTNLPNRTIRFGLIPVSLCPCWGVTYDWRVLYPFCCSSLTVVSLIWQFGALAIHYRVSLWCTRDIFLGLYGLVESVWTCPSSPPQSNTRQKNKKRCVSSHRYDARRKQISKCTCAHVGSLAKQEFWSRLEDLYVSSKNVSLLEQCCSFHKVVRLKHQHDFPIGLGVNVLKTLGAQSQFEPWHFLLPADDAISTTA